jgi:hypothetical protein
MWPHAAVKPSWGEKWSLAEPTFGCSLGLRQTRSTPGLQGIGALLMHRKSRKWRSAPAHPGWPDQHLRSVRQLRSEGGSLHSLLPVRDGLDV